MSSAQRQPVYQHLQELRRRLLWCVVMFLIGGSLGYVFRLPIIEALQHPLNQELFYTSPSGSFEFVMRICGLTGIILALPAIVYHVLRFIEPALPARLSARQVAGLIIAVCSLALFGVAFGYTLGLPATLRFFNQVGAGGLHALITADQYFRFVLTYLGIFAVVFQLPLLILFINRITPLKPGGLRRARKFVIVGSFAAPLLTAAPDPLSQVILALPIIVLYEASIWLLWLVNHPATQARAAQVAPPAPAQNKPAASAPVPTYRPAKPAGTLDLRPTNHRPAPRPRHVLDLRPARSQS